MMMMIMTRNSKKCVRQEIVKKGKLKGGDEKGKQKLSRGKVSVEKRQRTDIEGKNKLKYREN